MIDAERNDDAPRGVVPRSEPRKTLPRRIGSRELLAGAQELVIVHDGRDYRLRITQNGKLILTA